MQEKHFVPKSDKLQGSRSRTCGKGTGKSEPGSEIKYDILHMNNRL